MMFLPKSLRPSPSHLSRALRAEHVDAQAGEVRLGLARLLLPLSHRVAVVEREDAEAMGILDGHRLDGDGHVGALAAVLLDERPVVHLVDVVTGEDEHDVRARLLGWHRGWPPPHRRCRDTTRVDGPSRRNGWKMRMPPTVAVEVPGPARRRCGRSATAARTGSGRSRWSGPELTQLDSVKSMMRNLPAKGTAGLARTPDSSERRSPSPPARTTAKCSAHARDATPPPPRFVVVRARGRTCRSACRCPMVTRAPRPKGHIGPATPS